MHLACAEPTDLAVERDERDARWCAESGVVDCDDHGGRHSAARGQGDDIARAQGTQGVLDRLAVALAACLGCSALDVAQVPAQGGVLLEVAQVALHCLAVSLEGFLVAPHLGRERHYTPVGLELGEGGLQDVSCERAAHALDEAHGHVVGRAETRTQRIGAGGCQAGKCLGVQSGMPHDDRVPFDVDSPTTGTTGELRVLPWRDIDVILAIPLHETFEDHGARGHVDAQGKRLGGKDHLDQSALKEVLNDLLEQRQEACVVRGDAPSQPLAPGVESQDAKVLMGEVRRS